jgi:hypothetical protein
MTQATAGQTVVVSLKASYGTIESITTIKQEDYLLAEFLCGNDI